MCPHQQPSLRCLRTTDMPYRTISDDMGSRTLKGPVYYSGNAMTASACINFCNAQGFVYAGTEYAGECCEYPFPRIWWISVP